MIQCIKKRLRKLGLLKIVKTFWTAIIPGFKVYMRIIKKYGDDVNILIGQHPGTGDVYLQSMMIKNYCQKKGIKNYVFTVIGVQAQKVTKLFNIDHVELLTQHESNHLVRMYKTLFGKIHLKINILHYHPMELYYDEFLGFLRNYKGLNFYQMMSLLVFDGVNPVNAPLKQDCNKENIDLVFKKYKLERGYTVLLSPYANSLNGIPLKFWEKLASELNERGYRVCTNSFGLSEPPIKGTCGVALQYSDIIEFVEQAGTAICLRSGLCDIISSAKCRKIILYPSQDLYSVMGGLGSSYEYFSLNRMGLCYDAIEYELPCDNKSKISKIRRNILSLLPPKESVGPQKITP